MFDKAIVNAKRQIELDVARGLAVLFMILIHSQLYFANTQVIDSIFGSFNDFVGMVPSAPMFMFLLGVGIVYSRSNNAKTLFKRALQLILLGYLLNFVRGFLPNIINWMLANDSYYLQEALFELSYVDILQFSGLAMFLFSAIKYFNLSNKVVISITIILLMLNPILVNVNVDNLGLSALLGLVWGTNHYAFFPFMTWFYYPILGYLFAQVLQHCNDKSKFYIGCGLVGILLYFGGQLFFNNILGFSSGLLSDVGYYHHLFSDNFIFSGILFMELAIISLMVRYIPDNLLVIIKRWSKNVTNIFVIHWLIITWSSLFVSSNSLSILPFLLLLIVIIWASDIIASDYLQFKVTKKPVFIVKILFEVILSFGLIYLVQIINIWLY